MQDIYKVAAVSADGAGRLKFAPDAGFQRELRRRVESFIRHAGIRERDCPAMYLKSAAILALFALTYVLLVFFARNAWQALPLAVLLGLAIAEIGMNIEHDGSHKAYSDHAWVNKLAAMTLDMVGASSFMWRWKHVVFHHMYVNVKDHDSDIELGIFGRLSPGHPRHAIYRWQHWYLWPLYGVMVLKWQYYDDYRDLIAGRMGVNRFPRPRGWDLVVFAGGKLSALVLGVGLPLLVHPLWTVIAFCVLVTMVVGVVLSVVFQLAHTVEEARFPLPRAETLQMQQPWAVHQVESSVDFARGNRLVSWLVGGLNFQIEHHLFPTLCHVNYPVIAPIVEETCREFGVRYTAHPSLGTAVASHFRWLRRMGAAETAGAL
jgi:linoleoyl-CoA desaturase